MKKKIELAIDEDLLKRTKAAADETSVDLSRFIEGAIRERLVGHEYWKMKRKSRLKELEHQKGKSAVDKLWGIVPADREAVEAILEEDSYLDV